MVLLVLCWCCLVRVSSELLSAENTTGRKLAPNMRLGKKVPKCIFWDNPRLTVVCRGRWVEKRGLLLIVFFSSLIDKWA